MDDARVESPVDDEHYRLGGRPPLKTLFILLFGPLLTQIAKSAYGLVDSLWISKSNGVFGMTVLSSIFLFDYVTFSFGQWILISVSTQISYMFGSSNEMHAPRVVVDMIRFSFLSGLLIGALLIPCVKPIVIWLTSDHDIANEAFKYMLLLLCFMFSNLLYLLCIGVLQGEGRAWISGVIQTVTVLLNMVVLEPLFLLYFKMGIWSAALATVISEFIPCVILLTIILKGKLSMKFEACMFLQPFSNHTYTALKVGFASFILHLSSSLPEFVLQKYMTMSASRIGELSPILAIWEIYSRFYEMGLSIIYAFEGSYLPAAAYAYGKKFYSRMIKLTYHTLWITIVWCIGFSIPMMSVPKKFVHLWSNDPQFLFWAGELFPMGFLTLFLWPLSSIPITFLEAGNFPGRASLLSVIVTLIPLPLVSSLIYFLCPENSITPQILFSSYIWADVIKSLLSIPFVYKPFNILKKTDDFVSIQGAHVQDEEALQQLNVI